MAIIDQWQKEITIIKSVISKTGLIETTKWGVPVYTWEGKNIVGIAWFKNHLAIWFYNGVFLKDEKGILVNAQEEKTKALRQWKFNKGDKINEKLLYAYVMEAIENQKQGRVWKSERNDKVDIPEILQTEFLSDKKLKEAFGKLTLSKQKEYSAYIEEAKRESTKISRIQKILPMIMKGVGLNDRYLK